PVFQHAPLREPPAPLKDPLDPPHPKDTMPQMLLLRCVCQRARTEGHGLDVRDALRAVPVDEEWEGSELAREAVHPRAEFEVSFALVARGGCPAVAEEVEGAVVGFRRSEGVAAI